MSIRKWIAQAVKEYLDGCVITNDKRVMLSGYNPLPDIKGCLFEWLYVPFNGVNILCEVRYSNYSQLMAEGYNLAQICVDATKDELSDDDKYAVLNAQEYLAKITLNRPTYADFEKMAYGADNVIREKRIELDALEEKLKSVPDPKGHDALEKEIQQTRVFLGYILPADAMAALTRVALGADVSDIKKLTKEVLLEAGQKGAYLKRAPHEFISGVFTDRDMNEVDDYCLYLYQQWEKENGDRRGNHRS
jgi:hypothetical protein